MRPHNDRIYSPDSPAHVAAPDDGHLVDAAWRQFESLARGDQTPGSGAASAALERDRLDPHAFAGYRILQEIHRGGQGVVYQAIQESTRRKVAIKVLKQGPFADATEVARFEREVQVLSRLNHPNIVTIHDRGRSVGHSYLVMDYVPGKPLDTYLADTDRPVEPVLRLFVKICEAVHAAHLRGIIHRDLKPKNIRIDDSGEPHILDFGLAKVWDNSGGPGTSSMDWATVTGQFVGSMPWASPEQVQGHWHNIDLRTDVYSLGVILYQMITEQFPYSVLGTTREVQDRILHAQPARPSLNRRGIDDEIDTIVLKCLAKEPQRRYQSAGELSRDIGRYLADEPIEAKRDSFGYVLRKQLRKYKLPVAIAALFALTVAAGLVFSIAQWRRADHEADQARAINDFMRAILTSVEPERQGADVRLIDVLGRASDAASRRFAGRPSQEAQIRDLIGQTYDTLTMWRESKEQHAKACALWQEYAGSDDSRALAAEYKYVGALLNMAQAREPEQILPGLLEKLERTFGSDDRRTLDARRGLAMVHLLRGRLDDSEHILTALRAHPQLHDDDAIQIDILHNLLVLNRRRWDKSEPDKCAALLAEGESLAREKAQRSSRRYGPHAVNTLDSELRLAQIACERGHYSAAASACRAILDTSTPRLGECHQLRAAAMYTLAFALACLGDEHQPAELLLHEIECERQILGSQSPSLLATLFDAMRYIDRANMAVAGEARARELTAALEKLGGGHGDMLFDAKLFVARFISKQDRLDEAEESFQSLLARENEQISRPARVRLHLFYGSHLARRRLFEEGERELENAAKLSDDIRKGTWDTLPDDIVVEFIALYQAWNKPDKAREYASIRKEILTALLRDDAAEPTGGVPSTAISGQ